MKKWLVVIFAVLTFTGTAIARDYDDTVIGWHPVCRHDAIYWAMTVGEQFPTRIMYGWFIDKNGSKYYHVQPQLYLGDKWWYFKVENHVVKIITKPSLLIYYPSKNERLPAEWAPQFTFPDLKKYLEFLDELLIKGPNPCDRTGCYEGTE